MSEIFYTYIHYRSDTKEPFYIGKGSGNRYQSHRPRSSWWNNVVAKHGFTAEILAYFDSEDESYDHEFFLIDTFRKMGIKLCNVASGGRNPYGYWNNKKRPRATMENMWAANRGRKQSLTTRQKRSVSMMGKNAGEKNGMYGKDGWNKGKTKADDPRIKGGVKPGNIPWNKGVPGKTGADSPTYDTKIYHFCHTSGIEETCTRGELYNKYDLDRAGLCMVITGKRTTHKGWSVKTEK